MHPFSGEIHDGQVWGRGAVDMKDFDAMLLSTVRARARAGVVPDRPLVLCFTADEEAGRPQGGRAAGRAHREWFEDCTFAVGEVGGFSTTVRGRRLYLIEAAEKGMAWMRLTAKGNAGHGSMRHPDNAVTTLAEAVGPDRPARVAGAADPDDGGAARRRWESSPAPRRRRRTPRRWSRSSARASRMLGAVIRHTTNPTMLEAGYKVNVVPGKRERPGRRPLPARATRTSSWPRCASSPAPTSRSSASASMPAWRRRTTGRWPPR